MMVVEVTSIAGGALPIPELKAQLRMGSGFGDDSLQDAVLESLARAAIAAIEARIGKALLRRQFVWTLTGWRDPEGQCLPVAPVVSIDELRLFARSGAESVVAPSSYRLIRDSHRPMLRPTGPALPAITPGGTAELLFTAGYGATWAAVPPDLAHAVLLLAAHYYEHRHDTDGDGAVRLPFGVSALIESFRALRLGAGPA